jgi:predicted Rossmann fold flavoprotein
MSMPLPSVFQPPIGTPHLVIIGAGAAGCFAAIQAKTQAPHARVTLLEASSKPLAKVRISGGGRCNVTHACFDPTALVAAYPRGGKALHGLFARFTVQDTIDWFAEHGVPLKTEDDGRMFPTTNDSATIVACLLDTLRRLGVGLHCRQAVKHIARVEGSENQLALTLADFDEPVIADAVLIATGGSTKPYEWLEDLGLPMPKVWVDQVPSLFTFCTDDPRLVGLAGVSIPNVAGHLAIPGVKKPRVQVGPWLVTHWGLSGPVVLRLSAWEAKALHEANYNLPAVFDFAPDINAEDLMAQWQTRRMAHPRQFVATQCTELPDLPKRLWHKLLEHEAKLNPDTKWADVNNKALKALVAGVKQLRVAVTGKGAFKEEFVTAGGVTLTAVNMRTMQCKALPGLYFAGEVLDIDGITGGYNFQAAWSGGFVAGSAMAAQVQSKVESEPLLPVD